MTLPTDEPTLVDLLVPSILEKNPQRFDKPWNPDWIVAIGMTAGPAVAGFFAAANRDRLDRHRVGFWGVILGVLIQLLTALLFLSSSGRVVMIRTKEVDAVQSLTVDIIVVAVVYLIAFSYSVSITALQTPRYQLYRSMKLPPASGAIPAAICIVALILTASWMGFAGRRSSARPGELPGSVGDCAKVHESWEILGGGESSL